MKVQPQARGTHPPPPEGHQRCRGAQLYKSDSAQADASGGSAKGPQPVSKKPRDANALAYWRVRIQRLGEN